MTNSITIDLPLQFKHSYNRKALDDVAHLELDFQGTLYRDTPKKSSTPRLLYRDSEMSDFCFNFADYWASFRREKGSRGPLYKAISRACPNKRVVDATVGTGKDSVLLASWGFTVIGFERNPLIYLLLQDALRIEHETSSELSRKVAINYGNYFDQIGSDDVVYYDPMYPHHESAKKSALPRQEIQLFRKLIINDEDIEENVNKALELAEKLILKRSLHSKEVVFGNKAPITSYKGKNTRYDLFQG